MKIERGTPPEWGDEDVTRVLRDVYASPAANASYWDMLESRIMARIATAGESPEWWGVFRVWVHVGLRRALLAGVLLGRDPVAPARVRGTHRVPGRLGSPSVIPAPAHHCLGAGPGGGKRTFVRYF